MTIEWSVFLSTLSVAAALLFNFMSNARARKAETEKETREITVVITKLDNISDSLVEMKSGFSNHDNEIKENRERVVKVEEMAKSAHKRIDKLENNRESQRGDC